MTNGLGIGHFVMPMLLSQVLEHPSLRAADPVLRAAAPVARAAEVRWVHSSEVLHIAPLLRGGELLLTGGVTLASATPEARRQYAAQLAARGVAAVAVETGGVLATVPRDLVQAAEDVGLPLVELRTVVPFVEVAEAINSLLVNDSVVRLQRADELAHVLSAELTHGGGLPELVAVLARAVSARVVVTDGAGEVLADAGPDHAEPDRSTSAIHLDVPVRGVIAATVRLEPSPEADVELARVAGKRAVDALALALLRYRPPSPREAAGAELLRAVTAEAPGWRLTPLCTAAGLDAERPLVGVRGRALGAERRPALVEHLLRRRGRSVVAQVLPDELTALVSLPADGARRARQQLREDLARSQEGIGLVLGLGPVAEGITGAARSLREAQLCLDLAPPPAGLASVVDADDLAVERLAARDLDPAEHDDVARELLGELLSHDAARNLRLLETLDVWLTTGCSTTATARRLHLQRQSLHHRLQKVFELVGGDPRGTPRMAGLHLAVRLARSAQPPRRRVTR